MLPHRTSQAKTTAKPTQAVFALNGTRFAVPAQQVVEVIKIGGYAPLPCESPAHLGLVVHRDAVIPLVDLGMLLDIPRPGAIRFPILCMILKGDSGAVACPVDQVLGLATAGDEAFSQYSTLSGGISVLRADAWEARHGQTAAR